MTPKDDRDEIEDTMSKLRSALCDISDMGSLKIHVKTNAPEVVKRLRSLSDDLLKISDHPEEQRGNQ